MPYEYDVFISYRRHQKWPHWVKQHFLPKFEHLLGEELGRDAVIFVDDQEICSGVSLDKKVIQSLLNSRILVPLWSRQYFTSTWCKFELAHMLARQKKCGFGTDENNQNLIVPATIHDGNEIPKCIRYIKYKELNKYANPWMTEDSKKSEALYDALEKWISDIVSAIHSSPKHDSSWRTLLKEEASVKDFFNQLNVSNSEQNVLPGLG